MNPLTHLKKTRILRNIFLSLGAIFVLVTAAYAQNLYVSANRPQSLGGHAILEFTPSGVQSTYATGLDNPRGLTFDSTFSNLFAAHNPGKFAIKRGPNVIGTVLKFDLQNHVSTVGSAVNFVFEGLAVDMAGNAYVMAQDLNSPTLASTIFKFTPDGERIVFGSVPGQGFGLAFDSAGNLFAADVGDQTIFKFTTDGTRTVFAGPSAFTGGAAPIGLAFDSAGNLYVSTVGNPGSDTILEFTPTGVESTFATGLTNPKGLAFDSLGHLFVAEANAIPDGDILEFAPDGSELPVFASGFGRPEFLTFGPPR